MRPLLISIFLLTISLWSCNNKTKDCTDEICTELFAQITVEISSSSNPTLEGVSTISKLKKDGSILHQNPKLESKYAVIVDDNNLTKLGFRANHDVILEVYINGKLFGEYEYTIQTDCCHVAFLSGLEKIVLL